MVRIKVGDLIAFRNKDGVTQISKVWYVRPQFVEVQWSEEGEVVGQAVRLTDVIEHFSVATSSRSKYSRRYIYILLAILLIFLFLAFLKCLVSFV